MRRFYRFWDAFTRIECLLQIAIFTNCKAEGVGDCARVEITGEHDVGFVTACVREYGGREIPASTLLEGTDGDRALCL